MRAYWAKLSKKEILDTHQKKETLWLIIFLVFFWYFLFFFCFLGFFFCCFFFRGFKGQVRWPEGLPHLALNPPYFCFFLSFCFFFGFFFWGFKGQVRWPEGPPHLALNPPYFCFFCFLFCVFFLPFLSLLLIEKKTCFPPRKGIFVFFVESPPFVSP